MTIVFIWWHYAMSRCAGTTKLGRLEENIAAANINLTAEELARIEGAAAQIHVEGERDPEHLMATTGR